MVHPCPKDANPAEWMLEVVGAPWSIERQDYSEMWKKSTTSLCRNYN